MSATPLPSNIFLESDWRLADWHIQPKLNLISQGSQHSRITPKCMAVLCCLAQIGGVISRDDLLAVVWSGEHVTDDVVTHAISALRKALGDNPRRPNYIQTIPKKGYRLLHQPRTVSDPDFQTSHSFQHATPSNAAPDCADTIVKATSATLVSRGKFWLAISTAMALTLGWWAISVRQSGDGTHADPVTFNPTTTPVTSFPGMEKNPAFSPTGEKIVFSRQGNLFIKLNIGEDFLQLTDSAMTDDHPQWHPNGQEIIFTRSSGNSVAILAIPGVGGSTRQLAQCRPNSFVTLSIHPKGNWLAFNATEAALGGDTIFLLHLASLQKIQLSHLPENVKYSGDNRPVFSPDGRHLAFLRSQLGARAIYLQTLPEWLNQPPSTSKSGAPIWPAKITNPPRRILGFNQDILGLTWYLDGRRLLYAAQFPAHSALMSLDAFAPDSKPTAITVNATHPTSPTIGKQGLAFVDIRIEQNIWEYTSAHFPERSARGQPFLPSTRLDFNPRFSMDGKRIAFASSRSGSTQIWLCNSKGEQLRQVTQIDGQFAALPSWSHDGRFLSFTAFVNDQLDLYLVDVASGKTRALVTTEFHEGLSAWSHDDHWVYFSSNRGDSLGIWRVTTMGGESELIVENAIAPRLSNQGSWLYYVHAERGGIWRRNLIDASDEKVVDDLLLMDWNQWDLQDRGLFYVRRPKGQTPAIRFMNLKTGHFNKLCHLEGLLAYESAGLSVWLQQENLRILISKLDVREGDILMVEGFR